MKLDYNKVLGHRTLFLFSSVAMMFSILCMLQVRRGEARGES